jgi:hypothetical protein
MSAVERFEPEIEYGNDFYRTALAVFMEPDREGKWVRYEDHCKALEAEQEEAAEVRRERREVKRIGAFKETVALMRSAAKIRDGRALRGAPSHVLAELANQLNDDGFCIAALPLQGTENSRSSTHPLALNPNAAIRRSTPYEGGATTYIQVPPMTQEESATRIKRLDAMGSLICYEMADLLRAALEGVAAWRWPDGTSNEKLLHICPVCGEAMSIREMANDPLVRQHAKRCRGEFVKVPVAPSGTTPPVSDGEGEPSPEGEA